MVFLVINLVWEYMEGLLREYLEDLDLVFMEGKGLRQGVVCWRCSIWWRKLLVPLHRIYREVRGK